jgi:TRAP-type C4-dicarboxylate transport system substrate-binding protein
MQGRKKVVWAVIAAISLVACQDGRSVDKTGGDTLVLQFASIDPVNDNGQSFGPQAFVDGLSEVSDGRLKVEIVEGYGDNAAVAESDLVEAIAAGEIDGGWPSTRAFANAGISGLEVVEAPMTITSYDAEKELVSSPVADQLLARLEGSGVVGLGLGVGPLRRPFAAEAPLLGIEDWEGVPFRVFNSPVQSDAVQALNGIPVNVGTTWPEDVAAGTLRGAEFDIAQYDTNGLGTEVGNVTANVVLWPKVFVFSMSQERFDSLTEQQQAWVREAAELATQATVDATYDETTLARGLCEQGVRFVNASADQLSGLQAAFQPVIAGLAAAPADAALLEAIQGIAAKHPGPEQPDVPSGCTLGTASEGEAGGVPTEASNIPEGVYRVETTVADVAAAGLSNGDGWSGTWTLTIVDGTYELTCHAIDDPGIDCGGSVQDAPLEWGELRGTDDIVHFVGVDLSYVVRWATDGDILELTEVESPESPDEPHTLVLEPWTRID